MFRCDTCKQVSLPREPQTKKITERKPKVYSNPSGTSEGWEIAKEIKICTKCAGTTVN